MNFDHLNEGNTLVVNYMCNLTKLSKLMWPILGNGQTIMAMDFGTKAKATKLRVRVNLMVTSKSLIPLDDKWGAKSSVR